MLNFYHFIIFCAVLKTVISQCVVNNENIPEGCHTCTGTDYEQIFQIGVCKNANLNITPCELGKRCVMATQCQATCEVLDERECTVSVCEGSTGKDGCLFCNGTWQNKKTPLVMCKSGRLSLKTCPRGEWCMKIDECQAKCGKVVDGNQDISSSSWSDAPVPVPEIKESGSPYTLIFIFSGIAIVVLVLTILGICWCFRRRIRLIFVKRAQLKGTECLETYLKQMTIPNMCSLRLIPLDQIIMDKNKLGEGEFGAVYAGKFLLIKKSGKKFPVAIKVINKNTNLRNDLEQEMIKESGIMAQLDHEHLLKLVGICVANGIKIITPLRPLGSLHNFLQTKKQYLGPRELTLYCYQIASAMEYLARHNIVHRDLATRNVLMKRNTHVEVADFGLSALLERDIRSPQKLPFRWVPLECLNIHNHNPKMYCEASDVWSYGVTCWEILTFAEVPYRNLNLEPKTALYTLSKYLSNGNRLEKPSNCGLEFYQMLLLCWAHSPKSRPEFSMLKKTLEKFKRNSYAYVNDHRQHPNQLESPIDSDEVQAELITNMLGQDDYLYDDKYVHAEENPAQSSHPNNYYMDANHRVKNSNSVPKFQYDNSGYLLTNKNEKIEENPVQSSHLNNYYIDRSFKKSNSDPKFQYDASGYLISNEKIEENSFNNPKLCRSSSYIDIVGYRSRE